MIKILKIAGGILIIAGFLILSFDQVQAQESEPVFLVTWGASAYAPVEYLGKVLPTAGSLVEASLELVDREKLVNLAGYEIYWYLNDEFLKGEAGLQETVFRTRGVGKQELRIKINNYRGRTLIKNVIIPSVKPEAVAVAPFTESGFASQAMKFQAQAYFFNVKTPDELNFDWEVNGRAPTISGNTKVLDINFKTLPPGKVQFNVSLNIRHARNFLEVASREITLTFKK